MCQRSKEKSNRNERSEDRTRGCSTAWLMMMMAPYDCSLDHREVSKLVANHLVRSSLMWKFFVVIGVITRQLDWVAHSFALLLIMSENALALLLRRLSRFSLVFSFSRLFFADISSFFSIKRRRKKNSADNEMISFSSPHSFLRHWHNSWPMCQWNELKTKMQERKSTSPHVSLHSFSYATSIGERSDETHSESKISPRWWAKEHLATGKCASIKTFWSAEAKRRLVNEVYLLCLDPIDVGEGRKSTSIDKTFDRKDWLTLTSWSSRLCLLITWISLGNSLLVVPIHWLRISFI